MVKNKARDAESADVHGAPLKRTAEQINCVSRERLSKELWMNGETSVDHLQRQTYRPVLNEQHRGSLTPLTLSCRPLTKKFCDRRKLVKLLVESARQKSHTVHLRLLNQY